jgi:hypothetical protein
MRLAGKARMDLLGWLKNGLAARTVSFHLLS